MARTNAPFVGQRNIPLASSCGGLHTKYTNGHENTCGTKKCTRRHGSTSTRPLTTTERNPLWVSRSSLDGARQSGHFQLCTVCTDLHAQSWEPRRVQKKNRCILSPSIWNLSTGDDGVGRFCNFISGWREFSVENLRMNMTLWKRVMGEWSGWMKKTQGTIVYSISHFPPWWFLIKILTITTVIPKLYFNHLTTRVP